MQRSEKYWKVAVGALLLLCVLMLIVFSWELLWYQRIYLPSVWSSLSFSEQTMANIELALLDIRQAGAIGLLAWFLFKIKEGLD